MPDSETSGPPGTAGSGTSKPPPAVLLNAARDVFAARGYAAASMRSIAAAAGVSPGAPYKHVAGKAALYAAVVESAQEMLLGALGGAAQTAPAGLARIDAAFRASAALHAADPGLARFLSTVPVEVARHSELAPAVASVGSALSRFVRELVDDAVGHGEIAAADADAFGSLLLGALTGFAVFGTTVPVATHAAMIEAFCRLLDGTLTTRDRNTITQG